MRRADLASRICNGGGVGENCCAIGQAYSGKRGLGVLDLRRGAARLVPAYPLGALPKSQRQIDLLAEDASDQRRVAGPYAYAVGNGRLCALFARCMGCAVCFGAAALRYPTPALGSTLGRSGSSFLASSGDRDAWAAPLGARRQ